MAATVTTLQRRTDKTAVNQTIAAWARALPETAQDCRDLGHMWKRSGGVKWDNEDHCYRTKNACERGCGVSRIRLVETNGDIRNQFYEYPKDEEGHNTYLMPPGEGGWSAEARSEVRLAGIERVMSKSRARKRA